MTRKNSFLCWKASTAVVLLCHEWAFLMSAAINPRLHHFNSVVQTHQGNHFLLGNQSAMGYPLRMPPALVPYLANDLHMRRTGTPLIRKPRQAEARLSANQPGLVNDLGGSVASIRASEEVTSQEQLQEQLQELQERLQEFSADPVISAAGPEVAEPGGGFIQPGVYSCGHQGSEMFINFINPMYPAQDIMSGSCNFRVVVSNPSVCQLRVDFVNTELHGPQAGNCAEQFLVVGGDIWPTGFDKICGVNPDQHFYVHLDREKQAEADQGHEMQM